MLKRPAVITALIGLVFGVSCGSASTPTPTLTTNPVSSPTYPIVLTNTPTLLPTSAPLTSTPVATVCSWIAYLNRASTSPLSDENCLNELNSIGVSGDAKQVSFFADGVPTGTYGVCQDISKKDNLKFRVAVRDSIASARFLVTIGPDPIPIKTSSRAFMIQADSQEMYVKFLEYTSALDGYPREIGKMRAILDWKQVHDWTFDFILELSGSKVSVSMNKALFEQWQLNSPNRYLCFAYQATPTETQAAELEAQVVFR